MNGVIKNTKLCFISSNQVKMQEMKHLFAKRNIQAICVTYKINEIQCLDMAEIVTDKVKKAFKVLKRPVFVEQTGLYIEDFGGLPGGLTETVWTTLGADKFCDFFGSRQNTNAKAVTVIGYCDGKNVRLFEQTLDGSISKVPKGKKEFQWDCVFIPKDESKTIACLREETDYQTLRYHTAMEFLDYLETEQNLGGNQSERTD